MSRQNVLFLCVANSARSQMAEALGRSMAPPGVEIFSAGSQPSHVNPFAERALEAIGLTANSHTSKGLDAIPMDTVAWVITLCAEEICPIVPGDTRHLHWPHSDPAGHGEDEAATLARFSTVRDQLRERIQNFFETEYAPL